MGESLQEFRIACEDVCRSGDFITTDGYQSLTAADSGVEYWKRDFLFRSGEWRGKDVRALWRGGLRKGTTLVVGHSDLALSEGASLLLWFLGAGKIYGTNVVPFRDIASPLPLGLTNDCDDSPMHQVFGDHSMLQRISDCVPRKDGFSESVYVNFSVGTAERERKSALKSAAKLPNATFEPPNMTKSGRLRFLEQLRAHDFVLAPSGNGIDTHRFWEALYMGSIPIVRRNRIIESVATQIPCILVDSWSQLTLPGFLSREYEALLQYRYSAARLTQRFWNRRIIGGH